MKASPDSLHPSPGFDASRQTRKGRGAFVSGFFIRRPVATTLLAVGVVLAGLAGLAKLPVAALPQVDFPTISVQASLPGASPETMATSVATPLERHLGQIADVTEMTSGSGVGSTRVTLQFGLDRNIDGAARDVQAAINAARADLPTSLRSNPTYRKMNPADAPILILALTSRTLSAGQMYDAAASVVQQKLSQLEGVGQVNVGGSSLPAVRVELNPRALFKVGIGLEDVRAALAAANANSPKGAIEVGDKRWQLATNDQARTADQYRSLVIALRDGAAVRLADVAEVVDSVEDLRNQGFQDGQSAVPVMVFRQPGANIIEAVDRVKALIPQLKASIPGSIDLSVPMDRTTTIRASLRDVERSLLISVSLVLAVVFVFLRKARAALIPSVVVPVSLIGTFGVMYVFGYSLDNLSLMALIVASGFVVDDAIVVMENITRHVENGMAPFEAALRGAREVGFTVISMSLSLIAVFIPLLLMGGIVGRLFREFAVTLSAAVLVSLAVSLSLTPMMCARLVRKESRAGEKAGGALRLFARAFEGMQRFYARSLGWALAHGRLVLGLLLVTVGLNIFLYIAIPKGFFPQQDTGRLMGGVQADQSLSFQALRGKLAQFVGIVQADPAVESVTAFTGGGPGGGGGAMFVALKPVAARDVTADQVIARLRKSLAGVPGATLFLQAAQDIRVGGRPSNAQYQYTLQADDLGDLRLWTQKLTEALQQEPALADVNSDQQDHGLETDIVLDRDAVARLGLSVGQVDNALYDAFGQRQVSTIYNPLNQYHVVMEVAPAFTQNPSTLDELYVSTSGGAVKGSAASGPAGDSAARNLATNAITAVGHGVASTGSAVSGAVEVMVPFRAFSHTEAGATPLSVNHQGSFAAATISFNVKVGKSLSDAEAAVRTAGARIGMPSNVHGHFQGTAQAYEDSLANEPWLILAALLAVYIVLGVLYESLVHPLTILSTLPSAGVGAVLALWITGNEFSIIALIGVILLIGIVKKNAIMMIDFALAAEREQGLDSRAAIQQACLLRFRPIMMTTMAALFGALPLALGMGDGAELRRPLGIAIVGGLLVSQILTLYTTPVMYLCLDRWRKRGGAFTSGVPPHPSRACRLGELK